MGTIARGCQYAYYTLPICIGTRLPTTATPSPEDTRRFSIRPVVVFVSSTPPTSRRGSGKLRNTCRKELRSRRPPPRCGYWCFCLFSSLLKGLLKLWTLHLNIYIFPRICSVFVLCMRREEEDQVQDDGVGEAWIAAQAFGSWPQLDHGRCKLRGMLFDVLPVQSQSTRPNSLSLSLSLIFFSFPLDWALSISCSR
jgi:hypothetical protein